MLLDATCTPADIRYPTDLSLLNEAREKTEKTIDTLYNQSLGLAKKPRTYRKRARRDYLKIAKQRRPHLKAIRRAIGKQLGYLRRNLNSIDSLLMIDGHGNLSNRQSRELETIRILFDQQREMYQARSHRIRESHRQHLSAPCTPDSEGQGQGGDRVRGQGGHQYGGWIHFH